MQTIIIEALLILALALIFVVCRKKGFFSVLSLALTMIILLKFSIPSILAGANPVWVVSLSALGIIFLVIYLTEGFNIIAHISIPATIISFAVSAFLTYISVSAMGLSGLVSEESSYVVQYGVSLSNLQNILIAGIMIGTLGILIEMVVTQVALVSELMISEGAQNSRAIAAKAYRLGVTHLASMINTLFLIYAGVSLPLLIVLIAGQATLSNILHSQLLVSDIVSTLIGVVGLILSMPIATFLSVKIFKKNT